MSDNKKPRLAEILGVEVNQEWIIDYTDYEHIVNRIDSDGDHEWKRNDGSWEVAGWELMLVYAINHPESIQRAHRWTEDDIADAKAVRRLWPNANRVRRWDEKKSIHDSNDLCLASLSGDVIPSLQQPGEIVFLDEVLEAENG